MPGGRRAVAGVLSLCLLAAGPATGAQPDSDLRARAGVKLFRALLAADLELADKTLEDGKLLVAFFYVRDAAHAEELADLLTRGDGSGEANTVRNLELTVEHVDDPTFAELGDRVPAGIFLADPPSERALQAIVRYGIEHGVIVYSPYEGHVESGVLGGLSIEAQVRPYLNSATLRASRVSLKSFFLKVAKVYP